MTRGFFWLWVMFLILCLVTDSATYWVVRSRLSRSMDLALDAAIVGGVVEEDLIWGRHIAESGRAAGLAWEILESNMAGPLQDSLAFHFDLYQDKDRIWAEGRAAIETPFLLGALIGRGRREIAVNKKLDYLGSYK